MSNVPEDEVDLDPKLVPLAPSLRPPQRMRWLPKRFFVRAAWGLCAIGLYALLGFQLVPWVIHRQAAAFVRETYDRSLTMGEVRFNPFALSLELDRVSLPDADGAPLFAFDRLRVNFEALSSLFRGSYVLEEIALTRPLVRAVMRPDGALNFTDLAGERTQPDSKVEADDGSLPRLYIDTLKVSHAEIDFVDQRRPGPFSSRLAPLSFNLRDFRTTGAGGAFGLFATGDDGSKFELHGNLAAAPVVETSGKLTIRHAPLKVVAEYFGDRVPVGVLGGFADLSANYRVALTTPISVSAQVPRFALTDVVLRGRDPNKTAVWLPALIASNASLALPERLFRIEKIELQKLATRVLREADGSINMTRFLSQKPPPAATAAPVPPPTATPAWSVALGQLALTEAAVDFEDRTTTPTAKHAVAPLTVTVDDLSLDLARPLPVALRASIDKKTSVQADGSIALKPFGAELDVALDGVELRAGTPYVHQFADLTITGGTLGLTAKLGLARIEDGPVRVQIAGAASLRDLRAIDDAHGEDLLRLERMNVEGFSLETSPFALHIAEVALKKPFARVVLSRTQRLNVAEVLRSGRTGAAAPPAEQVAEPSAPRPDVRIDLVKIDDMRLGFADYHVQPNFDVDIRALGGVVRGLSSDPASSADVKLNGKLAGSAPVGISGKLQPFAYAKATDIHLFWKNVTLPIFNPYSGMFTGYNIARGELSTDLRYKLRDRKLDARHHVRIDQLTWGEATESKEAASLPLRLATALLRDRHGVIALDLPVTGRVDDPKFKLGPIIWQVVRNIVVKAGTAPFALLGSLFQGAEEARFVHFQPGEDAISPSTKKELGALAEALSERPSLTLDVPIGYVEELDRPALTERKYQEEVRRAMSRALHGAQQTAPFASLDLGDRVDLLEDLYEQLTGGDPDLPDAPPSPEASSFRERRALKRQFELTELEHLLHEHLTATEAELTALGQRRATAIEQALTGEGTLDLTRVLITSEGKKVERKEQQVRFELALN